MWLPRVTYLVWTCNDLGELALFLILSLHYGFNDTWMVRTQVYEAVRDSGFPYGLQEGEGSGVNPMLVLSLGTRVVQKVAERTYILALLISQCVKSKLEI